MAKWKVIDRGTIVTIIGTPDGIRMSFTKDEFNDICTAIDEYKQQLAKESQPVPQKKVRKCRHPAKHLRINIGTPYDPWTIDCSKCGHELTKEEMKNVDLKKIPGH